MDDLISRKSLLQNIVKKLGIKNEDYFTAQESVVISCIYSEPSAESEQQWIPCSERLPIIKNNIGTRVLITTSWGLVKEAHYCVDHWEVDGISYKLTSATAWMPLPEPWKGEDDADNSQI